MSQLYIGIRTFIILTLLTGIIYPFLTFVIGQTAFPDRANGSFIHHQGRIVGSKLIGQDFQQDNFFHGRFSSTHYEAVPASATNYSITHPELYKRIHANSLPLDFISSSGSGLDPHISPESARLQCERISLKRSIPMPVLLDLIYRTTEFPTFGLLGKKRVNVLALNIMLDSYQHAAD